MWSAFWDWIVSKVSFLYNDLLATLMNNVPASWQVTVDESIRPYINFVELWFPLNFAITMLIAWFTFLVAFIVFKAFWKFCVPFVG